MGVLSRRTFGKKSNPFPRRTVSCTPSCALKGHSSPHVSREHSEHSSVPSAPDRIRAAQSMQDVYTPPSASSTISSSFPSAIPSSSSSSYTVTRPARRAARRGCARWLGHTARGRSSKIKSPGRAARVSTVCWAWKAVEGEGWGLLTTRFSGQHSRLCPARQCCFWQVLEQ